MNKLFYDHLVVMEDLEIHISKLDISGREKEKMHTMIEETIHYRIMGRILEKLPKEHHAKFLETFTRFPYHYKNLEFLKEHVLDIEKQIIDEVKDLEKLLLSAPQK